MVSIIAKWQRCGKETCKCRDGMPHGPYFWLVEYISKRSLDKHRGKYTWTYLGRSIDQAWEKVTVLEPKFEEKYQKEDIVEKVMRMLNLRREQVSTKTSQPILSLEDENKQ